jgi:hypothetical protein
MDSGDVRLQKEVSAGVRDRIGEGRVVKSCETAGKIARKSSSIVAFCGSPSREP